MTKTPKLDGPIAGEHYTSDVRNYPWHRPPKASNYVEIVENMVQSLTKPQSKSAILTLLEGGDTIIDVVTGFSRMNVGKGNVSIDHAVLAAGPMAKLVETLATKAEIDFERGWDQEPKLVSLEKIRGMRGDQEDAAEEPLILSSDDMAEETPEEEGLMSMQGAASEDAQEEILGNDL